MGDISCSDAEFTELFQRVGATEAAKILNVSERSIYARRRRLEISQGTQINAPATGRAVVRSLSLDIPEGIILIGSDAHIWPGSRSPALRAFIKFCKDLKPKAVILNGDVLDLPQISRHPRIGWSQAPKVKEELEAAQSVLTDIAVAAGRGARRVWTYGNHDIRFESRLSNTDPEFQDVMGTRLADHFPTWEMCWSIFVNDNIVVKHRFRGGIHASYTNTLWAGRTIITGHLHSQKVYPFDDYNGTRYGVDTGCLADPSADAFMYDENNPRNWRSGFVVLTIVKDEARGSVLLPPEPVTVWSPESVVFRGKVINV